jgi:hypothetical protein
VRRDSGIASAMVLAVLTLVSVLFLAAVAWVELGTAAVRRGRLRDAEEARLADIGKAAVALLLADPTPEADSPFDPVWAGTLVAGRDRSGSIRVSEAPAGYEARLEDLSSRLGINWVRKELVADIGVLKPEVSADGLQQYREETGLHLDPLRYSGFVAQADLDALFTTRGWLNVNIADEFALRQAALARTGDLALAEDLRSRVQQARVRKKPEDPLRLVAPDGLADFLGPSLMALVPIVCAEPAMNVHFAPERVVAALVHHYNAGESLAALLVGEREHRELDAQALKGLLGAAAEKTPLAHYLGVRTWFWRLEVTGPTRRLAWVLARMPGDGASELRIVEEQWSGR